MTNIILSGLYFKLRKYNLPYPEAVFEGSYFRKDPRPFYGLIRELFPTTLTPTTTHKFFSLLHQKGLLRRVYTQNIDALEFLAGLPEDKIVEAHGSFQRSYCTKCGKTYDLRWLKHVYACEYVRLCAYARMRMYIRVHKRMRASA